MDEGDRRHHHHAGPGGGAALSAPAVEGRRGIVVIEALRGDAEQAGLRVEREVSLAGGRAGALVLRPAS